MNMRIEGGVLRFQLEEEYHQVPVVKEDIVIKTSSSTEIPDEFFQLLPNWTSVRLILDEQNGYINRTGKRESEKENKEGTTKEIKDHFRICTQIKNTEKEMIFRKK